MEEGLKTDPTSRGLRRKVPARSGVAIAIGTVVVASVATVGATTLSGHAISAGGGSAVSIPALGTAGDPSPKKGDGWINVDSWSWGATQSGSQPGSQGAGAGAGKITFNPFSITRKIDNASPSLYAACASGRVFPTLTFAADSAPSQSAEQGTPVENLQIVLTGASIHSCGDSGQNSGADAPTESLSFTFSKIEWKYTDSSGKLVSRAGWDLKKNVKA